MNKNKAIFLLFIMILSTMFFLSYFSCTQESKTGSNGGSENSTSDMITIIPEDPISIEDSITSSSSSSSDSSVASSSSSSSDSSTSNNGNNGKSNDKKDKTNNGKKK